MDLKRWYELSYIKIVVLFCTYRVVLSEAYKCTPGLNMPGYTIPQGDIVIEYGSPLNITCVVNNATIMHKNDSLSFKRNSETLPPEMINVLNSTAINLFIQKPEKASGDTYSCMLGNAHVCMNRVTVGIEPQKVTDFKCKAYNNENLTCTWTGPQNYVSTQYNLSFSLPGGRSSRLTYSCPTPIVPDIKNRMSCFWNISTTPPYRPVHELYNFTLKMVNKFGKNQINELFNHFAHVLSGPPENLTALSTTPSSIYLYWVVPLSMQTFPPSVHHRILYQCEYMDKTWHDGGMLTVKAPKKEAFFNLTNLKFAHALCDIRVSLRSAKALPYDEAMWSQNTSITVRTMSKIPDAPPETNVGSFETVAFSNELQLREAFIYWKQIPEEQQNGPDFKYRIVIEEDPLKKPVNETNSYAKFQGLSISQSYTFHIWSVNINGSSERKSTVYVPKQTDRVKEPVSFTKVELNEGEFELTWEPPKLPEGQTITNYTIFWCSNAKDRPYQCSGKLDWAIVGKNNISFNKTVDKGKIYQFAISANTHNSSSGMSWAGCTIIHNQNMGKPKNVWVNDVGPTHIELRWKLDCSDRIGSVEGYVVYYCPIMSPWQTQCKGPERNVIFNGTNTLSSGNITNLTPYTTYMLSVAVITKHDTRSQQSDPLRNTTHEAAPTPPMDFNVIDTTNTSITVSWKPPQASNGVIRDYKLQCCSKDPNDCKSATSNQESRSYTFTNLTSYKEYTIFITACTSDCSKNIDVSARTKMGHPSEIDKPSVDRRNDTSITIYWHKPAQPGGNNDYYIIRLKKKYKHANSTQEFNTTALKYVINNCGDGGQFNTFYISVKAVNTFDGKTYDGPWSEELENYCYTPVNYIMYLLLVIVIAALASIGFLFTRLYHRCKIMRDVEVKLPPGLAPVVADHTLVPWSTEKHQESQELLLVKMSEGKHCSGDSSGCSSGHESVTSSLESGTHLSSSSDSGTEQQGNYCALGEPKDSYIPVAVDANKVGYKTYDESSESSPYVMTGEPVKTLNPGYIPFNQTEPIEKSSGYVVAGMKNGNGYIPFNQTEAVSRNTGYVVAGIKNCKLD